MGFLAVILAALASFMFGAVWYGVLSRPWKADSGVPLGPDGNPLNAKSPNPYVIAIISMILVAGFLRLILDHEGVTGTLNGIQWGAGVGLFLISPWIALNNGFSDRPFRLTLIDGGYATIGCALMAAILVWLAPEVAAVAQ